MALRGTVVTALSPTTLASVVLLVVAAALAVRGIEVARQRRAAATAELRRLLGPVPTADEIEAYAQQLHQHHRAGTGNTCGRCWAEVERVIPR